MKHFRLRALLLGLLLVPVLCLWEIWGEAGIVHGTQMTFFYPPVAPVFLLAGLALVNALARRFTGRAWSAAELLLVYCMLVVASGLPSTGLTQFLIPLLPAPYYYATPENRWAALFHRYIPGWIAPRDPEAVKRLFEGLGPGPPIPWAVWVKPLALWSVLMLALYGVMFCLSLLFRRPWIDRERLVFPLVHLPLAMVQAESGGKSFWRSPAMWFGVALPGVLHTLDSLAQMWPTVPRVPLRNLPLDTGLVAAPWSAMRPLRMWIYPSLIGLSFLVNLEILRSCWVFYFLFKLLAVFGAATGLSDPQSNPGMGKFPFLLEQGAGAFLGVALVSLYLARQHLWPIRRRPSGGTPPPAPPFARGGEAASQRDASPTAANHFWPWVGLGACGLLMAGWCHLAGMSLAVTVAFFALYFAFVLAMTRMVAEGGMQLPEVEITQSPNNLIHLATGTWAVRPADWTGMAYLNVFSLCYRALMMPSLFQSLKIADATQIPTRRMAWGLGLAILVALPVSFGIMLWACYRFGGTWVSQWRFISIARLPFQRLASLLEKPQDPALVELQFVAGGLGVLLLLTSLRLRFLWWPLHPIGYAMAGTAIMLNLWFSMFAAWVLKGLLVRYGGLKAYRRSLPFFLGLILGDFLSAGVWILIEGVTGVRDHFLFP